MSLAVGALAVSCADEFDQAYPVPNKPANIAEYEYLNDYAPLKEYVSNPNFMLGAALSVDEFNNGGVVYQLATSNFTEVVAGNAMKMASCVNDKGVMDFGKVTTFVDNATNAGLNVFGHTLVWHAQQPKKWFEETLLADIPIPVDPSGMIKELVAEHTYQDGPFPFYAMGVEPPVIDGSIHFEPTGAWSQFFCCNATPLTKGNDVVVVLKIQSSKEGVIKLTCQNGWGGDAQNITKDVALVEGWAEVEVEFSDIQGGNYDFILKPETFDATLDVNSVSIYAKKAAGGATYMEELITNGDCEGEGNSNFVVRIFGQADYNPEYEAGAGVDGSKGIKFTTTAMSANAWDNQFFITVPDFGPMTTSHKVHVKMDVKADNECSIGTQAHGAPGGYIHYAFINNVNFKTEWTTHEFTGNVSADGVYSIAFNLNDYAPSNTFYFDNIVWEVEMASESGGIPQTPEQKRDTLIWAMDQWIAGMMNATGGKVKAWDLVNEAASGADFDGDGDYDLQSESNVNESDKASNFYWQDYIGDVDFVRYAASSARRHFKANGGEGELKLFINDYNLESTWDDNKKLKSLVNWIKKWECDTVKIDGIGSQMHISYNEDQAAQKKQEECVVNMLTIMAGTGKLVRISELDMGYKDKNGTALKTSELTEEQHKNMAKFYTFIVEKYLEIVPAAQQYGICQWCLTDAADDSGWRKGEPVGLWDRNYNRKHTYGGFAEGLK
jgi:GH35 family endo-1,4-beta-xylanase